MVVLALVFVLVVVLVVVVVVGLLVVHVYPGIAIMFNYYFGRGWY